MKTVNEENEKQVKIDRSGLFGCLEGYLTTEAMDYLTNPALDKEIERDILKGIDEDPGDF
jgi:hypothetical protein